MDAIDVKTLKNIKRNQAGFSLVELMVVATIMGVLTLGMANMFVNQSSSVGYLEDKLSTIELKTTIMSQLFLNESCKNTLGLKSILPTQDITTLVDKDNKEFMKIGDPEKGIFDRLKINSFQLANVNTTAAANESGLMELLIFTERQRKGGGPQVLAPISISLRVFTSATGSTIEDCAAGGGLNDEIDKACVFTQTDSDLKSKQIILKDMQSASTKTTEEPSCGFHCYNQRHTYSDTFRCDKQNLIRTGRENLRTERGSYQDGPEGPNS